MALPALQADYLFVGAQIVERIRATVPEIAPSDVMQIDEMDQADKRQAARGGVAFVLWDGDAFAQAQAGQALSGGAHLVQQVWTVLLLVRNAAQQPGAPRNDSAGPLLAKVHKALAGWTPPGAALPMHRTNGRRPDYKPNSGLYPLTFSIPLHL